MKLRTFISSIALSISAVSSGGASAVTTAEILQSGTSLSCLSWKATGTCIWLKCAAFICSVRTSLLVKHFNPEAVVQVYRDGSDAPWSEVQFMVDLATSISSPLSGGRDQSGSNQKADYSKKDDLMKSKLTRRLVDVVGSPAIYSSGELLSNFGAGCSSGVQPYRFYYSSSLDFFSWKYPYVDFLYPASFLLFNKEVGYRKDGSNQNVLLTGRWGNVFPRTGTATHSDHYKASAVMAQRAASIVTEQSASGHIASYLGDKGDKRWVVYPKEIKEWTSAEGKWQMLSPIKDSGCAIFGEMSNNWNPSSAIAGEKSRRSKEGDYVYQLWRPIECCERKGSFIMKIRWSN